MVVILRHKNSCCEKFNKNMGNFCLTIIENRYENHSSFLQEMHNINTDRFQFVISYGMLKLGV